MNTLLFKICVVIFIIGQIIQWIAIFRMSSKYSRHEEEMWNTVNFIHNEKNINNK